MDGWMDGEEGSWRRGEGIGGGGPTSVMIDHAIAAKLSTWVIHLLYILLGLGLRFG